MQLPDTSAQKQAKLADVLDASSPTGRFLTLTPATVLLHWPFLHPPSSEPLSLKYMAMGTGSPAPCEQREFLVTQPVLSLSSSGSCSKI